MPCLGFLLTRNKPLAARLSRPVRSPQWKVSDAAATGLHLDSRQSLQADTREGRGKPQAAQNKTRKVLLIPRARVPTLMFAGFWQHTRTNAHSVNGFHLATTSVSQLQLSAFNRGVGGGW